MRVVLVGGYGVFGSLLSELLRRDGHEVWIAGRNGKKARQQAVLIGGKSLELDLFQSTGALFGVAPDAVIDAAGPYQRYGDEPYRLALLCIEHGVHYLDLSDSAAFTAGIIALDEQARSRAVCALSGASSVPGLSSIVVGDLSADMDQILSIETAILPGNRAPRGRSVIASIVGSVGKPMRLWQGGEWETVFGWSGGRSFQLDASMERRGYLIHVPDCELFPDQFCARSVRFFAGVELPVMNWALTCLRYLRKVWMVEIPNLGVDGLQWIASLLRPFGSDRGGMVVRVIGTKGGDAISRRWCLIAESGEGPYVPGIVARALLRNLDRVEPGARPCLSEMALADIDGALQDLVVTTDITEERPVPLFKRALGERWSELDEEARALHRVYDVARFNGTAKVERGTSSLARLAALLFGFPPASDQVPVSVTKRVVRQGEIWERNFGGKRFRSLLSPSPKPHHVRERFGPFNFEQSLPLENGRMRLNVQRGWFLGIPMPRWALPTSTASEFTQDGVFHFDVALGLPVFGSLIVRYRGSLTPSDASTISSSN